MTKLKNIIRLTTVCVTAVSLVVLVGFLALTTMPELRRQVFSYVVPAYNLYQTIRLRSDVRHRRFIEAGRKLENQLDLAEKLSRSSSSMVIGMTESFELVFERARFEQEFKAMEPALKKLVEMEPTLYLGHIWLAKSLSFHDQKAALKHAEKALSIVPTDEKAYRLAIDLSVDLGAPALAKKFCQQYFLAQLGGPKPRGYYQLFRGTGLRKIGLETKNLEGVSNLILNYGLQLSALTAYEFNLTHPQKFHKLNFHLGTLPGVSIELHGLIFSGVWGEKNFSASNLHISSKAGYVLPNKHQHIEIITNSVDDDVIEIRVPQHIEQVTKVTLIAKFSRLPLTSLQACENTKH